MRGQWTKWRAATVGTVLLLSAWMPAAAAARAAEATPTYRPTEWGFTVCTAPATCEMTVDATSSGDQAVSANLDRPAHAPTVDREYADAEAGGAVSVVLSQPVPRLQVTFVWTVLSARGEAALTSFDGMAMARVFARGDLTRPAGCGGCRSTHSTDNPLQSTGNGRLIVDAQARGLGSEIDEGPRSGAAVSHTVTLTKVDGSMLAAGRYTARGRSIAFSHLGPDCRSVDGQQSCVPEVRGHSGWAEASARLRLTQVGVTT